MAQTPRGAEGAIAAPDDWFVSAFSPLVAEFWRAAVPDHETEAEALFLETLFERKVGREVRFLDVMCGVARLGRALATRGFSVDGLDVSADMLALARDGGVPDGLSLRQGDMRALDDAGVYDGAWCFGNSWGYLDHKDTLGFVAALHRALKPGARFIIETGGIAETVLPDLRREVRMSTGDFHFRALHRYDAIHSVLHTRFVVTRGAETATFTGRQWIYTVGELRRLFEAAGFTQLATYATTDFRPFRVGADRLLAVFERA